MFTGLVQGLGLIQNKQPFIPLHLQAEFLPDEMAEASEQGLCLTVRAAHELLKDLSLGASIALDGACTTIIEFTEEDGNITQHPDRRAGFKIEASPETLSKTIMPTYEEGSLVNLELPLTLNAPLGGHFVTGHVDGTAQLFSKVSNGLSWVYRFQVNDSALMALLVEKGSITVSGVSLTVNTIIGDIFSVAIIPHTFQNTTLGQLQPSDPVNLETDLLGKYVQRLLSFQPADSLNHFPPVGELRAPQAPALGIDPALLARQAPRTYSLEPNIHTGDWFNHQ